MSGISEKLKSAAFTAALQKALDYLEKDPEANALKVMDMVDKFTPDGWYVSQRAAVRTALETKSNWYRLMMSIFRLDPGVRRAFLQNFLVNASLVGSGVQEDTARREGCNVPWAILLDPTSACNLHCTGCWAAEYGGKLNLTLEEMDSIVSQGKKLGTYMYIFTGGEPLVRKKDVLALCERHPDCEFLLHQRHAGGRAVLPGYAAGKKLCPRTERGGL